MAKKGKKPVAEGLKRGRIGPEEGAEINKLTDTGKTPEEVALAINRSAKVVEKFLRGGSTPAPKASKAAKGKRGRPKGSSNKPKGVELGNGSVVNLRGIIREIVREELLAAFK